MVAGSLGLGAVRDAATVFAAAPGWVPVVVCGHNSDLAERTRAAVGADGVALGWVQDMAGLMNASDVLVENAGGLSSKEALRAGLPIVTFRPIAGHGRDDANALARLGLTEVVDAAASLLAAAGKLASDPGLRARRIAGGMGLFRGDAADSVERVASLHRRRAGQPLGLRLRRGSVSPACGGGDARAVGRAGLEPAAKEL